MSQLDLAAAAATTPRYMSFVETGRSQPSRDMVLRLAVAMDVPLRDRNGLLVAAGFAPLYAEHDLEHPAMEQVIEALQRMLDQHAPYPAIVMDRRWNVVRVNSSSTSHSPRSGRDFFHLSRRIPPRSPVETIPAQMWGVRSGRRSQGSRANSTALRKICLPLAVQPRSGPMAPVTAIDASNTSTSVAVLQLNAAPASLTVVPSARGTRWVASVGPVYFRIVLQ
jgi:transcriptional regulator with XRE-family HTH domain